MQDGRCTHSRVIHVRLPETLASLAAERAAGRHSNVSEYVRDLMRRDVLEAA